jgi:hypothetical protein
MKYSNMAKTEYIGIRTAPEIKRILQKLADDGYRSLSQQCEMAITEWLKENGYIKDKSQK